MEVSTETPVNAEQGMYILEGRSSFTESPVITVPSVIGWDNTTRPLFSNWSKLHEYGFPFLVITCL